MRKIYSPVSWLFSIFISTKVSMFANPYPYDSAVKFFGAVPGFGAQEIK